MILYKKHYVNKLFITASDM